MNKRSIITFGLLIMILLGSCAPGEAPVLAEPGVPVQPAPPEDEAPPPPPVEMEIPEVSTETAPTEALAAEPAFVATSRGDSLEATDPITVNLESGDIQLVEFFRYT